MDNCLFTWPAGLDLSFGCILAAANLYADHLHRSALGLQGSMRALMEGLLSAACEQESMEKPIHLLRLILYFDCFTFRYQTRYTRSPPHG